MSCSLKSFKSFHIMILKSKTLIRHVFTSSPTQKLCILDLIPFSRSMSACSIDPKQPSFEVSYLINSCGLSPESALKASKVVKFESQKKPDSVLAFFKNHGFSETQVSKIIKVLPRLITSKPEKTLLPKLQFFYSKGISVPDVAEILSTSPFVLTSSLENKLIPTFDYFTKFLQSENKAVNEIKRFPTILVYDFQLSIAPIIDIFRNYGVPASNIMMWLRYKPRAFVPNFEKLREIIEEVKKMGFDPTKATFAIAIHALTTMSIPVWERKVEVYKRWGWSHVQVLQAFRKFPWCMTYSKETMNAKMDFFVNKMGWDPSAVAHRPQYLSLSLEKRIIPRCSVIVELLSKGLINKKYGLGPMLESTEKYFLQKYVTCYKDEAPHLLKIYHEKLGSAIETEATDP